MLPATSQQELDDAISIVIEHKGTLPGISDIGTEFPGACQRAGAVLARIGDKWSVLILMRLATGRMRYNELKRQIGGISQRMLTLTLRGLERDGLVARTVYGTVPPRVDYALTSLGHSLRRPLEELGLWAVAHLPEIEQARQEFDFRSHANPAMETCR